MTSLKRKIALAASVLIVICLGTVFSYADVDCYHWSDKYKDTATLTKAGTRTYTCNYCGEKVSEKSECLLGQELRTMQACFWSDYFDEKSTPDIGGVTLKVTAPLIATGKYYTDDNQWDVFIPYADYMAEVKRQFAKYPDMKKAYNYDADKNGFGNVGGYGDYDHVVFDKLIKVNDDYFVYGHWVLMDYGQAKPEELYTDEYGNKIYNGDAVVMIARANSNGSIKKYAYKKCNYEKNCSHANVVINKTVPATESKAGTDAIKYCADCGKKIGGGASIAAIGTSKLSKDSYTYSGSSIKPEVVIKDKAGNKIASSNYTVTCKNNKSVGKATATITFKNNYSGTKALTFKINPKGTTLSQVTPLTRGFKATWKKQATQTTGYQIRYSAKSTMASAKIVTVTKNTTLSKSVNKLTSGKKYFVQIRTYKTVSGVKYYSAWSNTKSVSVK